MNEMEIARIILTYVLLTRSVFFSKLFQDVRFSLDMDMYDYTVSHILRDE